MGLFSSLRRKIAFRKLMAVTTYTVQAGDTFSTIAAKLGATVAALEAANPGVNPSNLQIGQVIQLPQPASTYTIVAGDTFSSIAAKLGTTVAALEAANPNVSPSGLQIGAQISIPSSSIPAPAPSPQPQPTPVVPTPTPTPTPATGTYTIAPGDTLTSIAAKLGTTVTALESANPGINPNDLQIGAQISTPVPSVSPAPQPTPPPAPAQASTYIIVAGDTFATIAAKLGTTVAVLESLNPNLTPTNLQVGASIIAPSNSAPATIPPAPVTPTPSTSGASYTIQAGDTFTLIAAKFQTTVAALEAANPNINTSTLQIGQVINLPPGSASSQVPTGASGTSPSTGGTFVNYSGPASAYPDPSQWATYPFLWQQNSALMTYNDGASEIALIGSSIATVAQESGIDARVILCLIMQESGGNVRVGNTNNGVNNTGIMQAYNGVSFNPSDPAGSILQMVRDGTEGTASGPGLKQAFVQYGNYYVALRVYNSGSVNLNQLNDPRGATANYVENIANRLMGHTWPNM
jgi:LysM repeat protein